MIEFEAVGIGELLSPVVALLVGTAQCLLIWRGLRQMERASLERSRQMDIQSREADKRHEEMLKRHEEADREADRRHEEALRETERRQEENEKRHEKAERDAERRHEEAMASLRALIERTSGFGPPMRA